MKYRLSLIACTPDMRHDNNLCRLSRAQALVNLNICSIRSKWATLTVSMMSGANPSRFVCGLPLCYGTYDHGQLTHHQVFLQHPFTTATTNGKYK